MIHIWCRYFHWQWNTKLIKMKMFVMRCVLEIPYISLIWSYLQFVIHFELFISIKIYITFQTVFFFLIYCIKSLSFAKNKFFRFQLLLNIALHENGSDLEIRWKKKVVFLSLKCMFVQFEWIFSFHNLWIYVLARQLKGFRFYKRKALKIFDTSTHIYMQLFIEWRK